MPPAQDPGRERVLFQSARTPNGGAFASLVLWSSSTAAQGHPHCLAWVAWRARSWWMYQVRELLGRHDLWGNAWYWDSTSTPGFLSWSLWMRVFQYIIPGKPPTSVSPQISLLCILCWSHAKHLQTGVYTLLWEFRLWWDRCWGCSDHLGPDNMGSLKLGSCRTIYICILEASAFLPGFQITWVKSWLRSSCLGDIFKRSWRSLDH